MQKAYGEDEARTAEFGAALASKRLLEPREIIAEDSRPEEWYPACILDGPDLLNEVADDIFLEWRRRGWLAPIYAHLSPRAHWDGLADLISDP